MRPLTELINTTDPAWPEVKAWIAEAKNKVEILSRDAARADDALYRTQVTTRSPMGAVIYQTGGLLIDHGWIRILGSGSARINRSLPDWNKGRSFTHQGDAGATLLIADDAVGGFFAINGGALGPDAGKIYYLAPDTLAWEALDLSYTDFLMFCFSGNIDKFYKDVRWKNWQADIEPLDGDHAISFYPFLWTVEGKNIEKASKKPVPIAELFSLHMDFREQLGISDNR